MVTSGGGGGIFGRRAEARHHRRGVTQHNTPRRPLEADGGRRGSAMIDSMLENTRIQGYSNPGILESRIQGYWNPLILGSSRKMSIIYHHFYQITSANDPSGSGAKFNDIMLVTPLNSAHAVGKFRVCEEGGRPGSLSVSLSDRCFRDHKRLQPEEGREQNTDAAERPSTMEVLSLPPSSSTV